MSDRSVFFVSDGTGITAETLGNSILAQFAVKPRHVRRPFIDTVDKAFQVVREINAAGEREGKRPVIFTTLANDEVLDTPNPCKGTGSARVKPRVGPPEGGSGPQSNPPVRRFSDASQDGEYNDRIDAINFTLEHDDGQSSRSLETSDVVLVGVSRSGKTPTSLYLAMQHGIKAANVPLIPEDFERGFLPTMLKPHKKKCFGLTIDPVRLSQIRNERRPGSKYASLENCRMEVNQAESMMRREGIAWLSSTHKSIEEIATTILRDLRPDRLIY